MTVVTRFAPSPTGFLHIGGVRTALFNWLYARANKGKFLLRIEDTDRERSTQDAVDAILDGLNWLGLSPDEPPVYQNERASRHRDVANMLVERTRAFRCYVTPEELEARRKDGQEKRDLAKGAHEAGDHDRAEELRREADLFLAPFRSPYRDGDIQPPAQDAPYVVRLRAPDSGRISLTDAVQGDVGVDASAIDDLVLLRSDGTPTYMLAVVVDDHDMGVTHIIRGDDHLGNTYRQLPIYQAMEWTPPKFAHVPLIHGPDGKKLSKRHGALGVEAYRDMGYLPEALKNYLLRLGWSHGDDEIISEAKAIEWFNLEGLGKAPARLDLAKLDHINAHYMQEADDDRLFHLLRCQPSVSDQSELALKRIRTALPVLKTRAATIPALAEQCAFLYDLRPIEIAAKLRKKMNAESFSYLRGIAYRLRQLDNWNQEDLADAISSFCSDENIGMGAIGPTLRAVLTGGMPAPDLGLVLEWLGREEALDRIDDQLISAE